MVTCVILNPLQSPLHIVLALFGLDACMFDLFWIDIEPDVPNIKRLPWDLWAIEPPKGLRFTLNLSFFPRILFRPILSALDLFFFRCSGRCEAKEPEESHQAKKNEDLNSISSFISKFEDNWLRLCCNPIRSGTSLNFQQIIGGVLCAFFRLSQLNAENWPKAGKKSDSDLNELRWKRVHSSWHYSFLFSSLMSTVLSLGKKWKSQSKKFPSNIRRRRRRRKEKLKLIQSLI